MPPARSRNTGRSPTRPKRASGISPPLPSGRLSWRKSTSGSATPISPRRNLANAEAQSRSDLTAAETAARAVADDAGWRRDVELAHGRLADVLRAKGDLDGAAAEERTRIDLAGDLVKLDPTNADWQRDLALGWAGLGQIATARHDAATATDMFAHCAAIPIKSGADPRDEIARDPAAICRAGEPH